MNQKSTRCFFISTRTMYYLRTIIIVWTGSILFYSFFNFVSTSCHKFEIRIVSLIKNNDFIISCIISFLSLKFFYSNCWRSERRCSNDTFWWTTLLSYLLNWFAFWILEIGFDMTKLQHKFIFHFFRVKNWAHLTCKRFFNPLSKSLPHSSSENILRLRLRSPYA